MKMNSRERFTIYLRYEQQTSHTSTLDIGHFCPKCLSVSEFGHHLQFQIWFILGSVCLNRGLSLLEK